MDWEYTITQANLSMFDYYIDIMIEFIKNTRELFWQYCTNKNQIKTIIIYILIAMINNKTKKMPQKHLMSGSFLRIPHFISNHNFCEVFL